ncbi:kelch repeat-containing protein, partial [marine sediment metagenome]
MLPKKLKSIALTTFPKLLFLTLLMSASYAMATETVSLSDLPQLPEPVANNAVASVTVDNKYYVFSFMGLGKGKTYNDVHNRAWQLVIDENNSSKRNSAPQWQALSPVPSSLALKGRLASVAVGVKDSVYILVAIRWMSI